MEHISLCGDVSFAYFSTALILEEENYLGSSNCVQTSYSLLISLQIELHYVVEKTTRILFLSCVGCRYVASFLSTITVLAVILSVPPDFPPISRQP